MIGITNTGQKIFQLIRPNPQFPADLVTLTEKILNGELLFLCSEKEAVIKRSSHFGCLKS